MDITEIQKSLPANLAREIAGYSFEQIHLGLSPSNVFRLESRGKSNLYLKIAPRIPGFSLSQEKLKLEWLENRLPVPKVLLLVEDENTDYLLLSEVSGIPASDDSLKTDILHVIEQLAIGLEMIHSLPIEDCPFNAGTDAAIQIALERMRRGLVDTDDFDEERLGRSVEDLARELLETKPISEDLVFTHGDYCVPNILLKDGKLSGFVDLGNAGIADRYQDLALLARSVGYNFGDKWKKYVFEFYGIEPNHEKINFFQLLDEFF